MTLNEEYFFLKGKIEEATLLAVCKNGKQTVGVNKYPLHKHIDDYKFRQKQILDDLQMTKEQLEE